ncbi:type VII secretion protein EssC [Clostridium sp. HBUAS56017]|uniref:type VII secretion protein EssC n=1 Tax=Clostridium sp. HBUAS56017 TaxID=2571128 RepID=UPI001178BDB5|nr:type VII secretion protein EssC [Clostridium sp. HBUAS56017]
MNNRLDFNNVLIVYNEEFYKEIDLDDFKNDVVLVGNTSECQIKLSFKMEGDFAVKFSRKGDNWQISDEDNTYCVINGVKVPRRVICNGDKIIIKNIESKQELFKINYFIDFNVEYEDYDRVVSLENVKKLRIGKENNNHIIIEDEVIDKNHAELVRDGETFYLNDLKSKFGVYLNGKKVEVKVPVKNNDFIIICGYKFLFNDNKIAMSKKNERIKIRKLKEINTGHDSPLEYPCFYRSPRLLQDVAQDNIVIDEPPSKAKDKDNNLIITMIPLLGTVVLTVTMNSNKGDSSSLIYTIGAAGLTAFVAILAFAMQTYDTKKQQFIRYKRYKEYVKEKEKQIIEKRRSLMESIRNNNPDTEDCISFLEQFDRRLWERTPLHEDFLNISLGRGVGDLTFDISVQEPKVEVDRDKLKEDPRKLKDVYGKMEDVPICINLTKDYPIGIYGEKEKTLELIKNIVIKISTLHYYEEVKIAAIYPKEEQENWEWLKWIPHTWSNNKNFRYIGNTKESAHNVLNQLYDEIKVRKRDDDSAEKVSFSPYYIIIIADRVLIENEPIMALLESGEEYGATGIFAYENLGLIPKESKKIIEVIEDKKANYIDVLNSKQIKNITFNPIDDKTSENFSRKMSPIFVKSSFTQSSLTSYFTLFDLYNIKSEEELPVMINWKMNKVYESMAVPLGVRAGDEVVYLNLHEKFHGPHGLVAGTTGSGKSEILQTYIASLAINYHPYDVSIIIIDYKGGGMANQFKDLPHLVGTITNLDGNQINRALISIKSELKRRQRIFSEYNVNHIDAYIKLFKDGKAKDPLPHLIMIADEFAELKNDQPDFMTELVSAARIGRSLGVHLILATQKPAGVVDDQIWSNSKFKLCLKVQDADDSNEMIKTPLAANIVEAGRAYFQVGNNEIFELFQSAWSGAKKYDDDDVSKKEIEISEVLIDGSRREIYSTKEEKNNKESKTQLDAVIDRINKVASENGIERLQGPWLEALKEEVYLNDIIGSFDEDNWRKTKKEINPAVGILDNPEKQIQNTLCTNLSQDGNMLIIGSPGVGKTTLIQTLVTSIIQNYTPDLVNIYMLDFGSRILKMYENAPQVGGVVTADDDELLKNFIKFIHKEIARRKNLLSECGVSNVLSYREVTGNILPHILVIIDNFAAFSELYEDYEDDITKFSRDGANLGITLVLTGSNSSDIRYKISSNFKINIALNCVDDSEYSTILGRVFMEPAKNEGRGLIKQDQICEFQTALPIQGNTEGERANNIKSLIEKLRSLWDGKNATPIPMISEILPIKDFLVNVDSKFSLSNLFIGLDENEFEYVSINLKEKNFIPIIGNSGVGKSNLIKSIAYSIDKMCDEDNYEIYVYDSETYGLCGVDEEVKVEFYSNDRSEIVENLISLKDEIYERKDDINDKLVSSKGKIKEVDLLNQYSRKILLIDNIDEFLNNIQDEYDALELFNLISERKSGYGFTIIAAGEEEKFNDQSYNHGFMNNVKKSNQGIALTGIEEQDYFNVRVSYSNKEKPIFIGDGYLIDKDKYYRIKVPKVDN